MNVFSKPLQINDEISYSDFFKKKIDISKMKLLQLKDIARKNKLPISGAKYILIGRIEKFFIESHASSLIQKVFRRYMVIQSFVQRGPGFKNIKKCVNDSDFVTLDTLDEIPFYDFYSYQDANGFIYGFSISSLISLFKQKGKLTNPYNRENMDIEIMNQIIYLHKLKKILFANMQIPAKPSENIVERSNNTNYQQTNHSLNRTREEIPNTDSFSDERELIERMREIQEKPMQIRIQELFMEIDQLGNYTDASWFLNLSTPAYLRYYRYLSDIWNYRGQLSNETKRNICKLTDPFRNNYLVRNATILEHDQIKRICINAMEHMIYTGVDIEFRKLGALHVLSALTIVSTEARQNMMWLYESVLY